MKAEEFVRIITTPKIINSLNDRNRAFFLQQDHDGVSLNGIPNSTYKECETQGIKLAKKLDH